MSIKISIITVCFNDLSALKQTSKSITNQKYSNIEWLVIDGGSSDGTCNFLSNNEAVAVFISEEDNGIYDAMNKGTSLATGDYLIYLNAGDVFYEDDSLDILINTISGADVALLGAFFKIGESISRYRSPRSLPSVWHSVPANHQATVFKREVIGTLPYNDGYKICGDYELIAKLYKKNVTSKVIDHPLVIFSLGGISTTSPGLLTREAIRVQREVLELPCYVIALSWLRRQCALYANLMVCKFNGAKNEK